MQQPILKIDFAKGRPVQDGFGSVVMSYCTLNVAFTERYIYNGAGHVTGISS